MYILIEKLKINLPDAIASNTTNPNVSVSDGITNISHDANNSLNSSPSFFPVNITSSFIK